MKKNRPTIGLVLGSGGARGLAHLGVIKVLEQHNIPIDVIAGTSFGALIGALYAKEKNSSQLEEIALSFNKRRGLKLFDPTLKGGLIKGNKVESFIAELLDKATFESLHIPFAAVATNYNTAEPVILRSGDLVKAVRASISVPAVFQPVTIDNTLLADGGLSKPVPVDVARSMGADVVIAVNLDTVYGDESINAPSLSSTPLHSINILRHHLAIHSSQDADVVISPHASQISLIGWDYFFDNKKAHSIIEEGSRATLDMIDEIKKIITKKSVPQKPHNRFIQFLKQHVRF